MTPPPFAVEVGALTDVGRVRRRNEDRYAVRPEVGVFLVADGMGGHDDGDVASAALARAVEDMPAARGAAELLAAFEARIIAANRDILAYATANGRETVGATLAALLVHSGYFACLWCGDSRVYLLRDGALQRLTRDHTEVQEMLDRGLISEAEAATWPRRNVLTRAVGVGGDLAVDMEQGVLRPGDVFLLCSDGLTGHVPDAEVAAVLAGAAPQPAAARLVALALERGGTDNVTAVVVRATGAPAAAPAARPRPTDVWE